MGVVYLAEQTKTVKRHVGLEIIEPGLDTHQVITRFGAERQAMGVMDQLSSAPVFEGAVTEDGRTYFVMELECALVPNGLGFDLTGMES